ncbi:beta-1,6-N-acetylglucosaminyltransferase [Paenibacillus pasadenensis]|uniref:beta-1,6-N-acetylglucosaminyltransferase n=1 Tax=Paenibacillus pasadenensis TaxID=217090 RepID=UPI00203EE06B|nr:beta-1,6-N-acetylglucosaminyltransferase [Paenibacillus pasadenensis]MCM3750210.1 beta-1,6-N-acetylglucosaminyltransferase [Paenibacillus pasadenensis]
MSLAYCITAHTKPNQLRRMIEAIYHENNYYVLHIDANASTELLLFASRLAEANENIFMLTSASCAWGGWSLVEVELQAISLLAELSGWSHYINLSGQDFPLASQRLIGAYLQDHPKKIFMNYRSIEDEEVMDLKYRFIFEERKGEVIATGERTERFHQLFPNKQLFTGSQWKVLTRESALYAAISENTNNLKSFFKQSFVPDEHFFQTVLLNSIYSRYVVNENLRFIDMTVYHSNEMVPLNAASPRVLTTGDAISMMSSSALFARKFDVEQDAVIIDLLEQAIKE